MKIIVASDSHYEKAMLMNLAGEIRRRGDIDAVIHLGDMEGDAEWLRRNLPQPVYGVPGNCDMTFDSAAEQVLTTPSTISSGTMACRAASRAGAGASSTPPCTGRTTSAPKTQRSTSPAPGREAFA